MADTAVRSVMGVAARQGILIAFILFMVGFTLWNPRFIEVDNVFGVIRSSAILGVMALGVTFVVIGGNLDLSVGSMLSFSAIVVLDLHENPAFGSGARHPRDVRADPVASGAYQRLSDRLPWRLEFPDRHPRHALGDPRP